MRARVFETNVEKRNSQLEMERDSQLEMGSCKGLNSRKNFWRSGALVAVRRTARSFSTSPRCVRTAARNERTTARRAAIGARAVRTRNSLGRLLVLAVAFFVAGGFHRVRGLVAAVPGIFAWLSLRRRNSPCRFLC